MKWSRSNISHRTDLIDTQIYQIALSISCKEIKRFIAQIFLKTRVQNFVYVTMKSQKRLQRSRQFILCTILLFSIIHSIQFLMHEAVLDSFYETHIIFLCIIRQLLCIKYVYEAGNKNHRRNYFRDFVRVIE